MEALRTHEIEQGGDEHMESAMTGIDEIKGMDVKDIYVGPSALWVAKRLPHRVRFHDGWFWTTATCHSRQDDGLAFRQRPDGEGIDARCHTGDCSPEVAASALGGQAGWPIRWAYEPLDGKIDRLWWIRYWPRWRLESYAVAALAFAVPLLLGHGPESAILAVLAFTVGALLTLIQQARRLSRRFLR